ncbi:glucosylglycerol-phosphate synthase [Sinimarinibacterium sp. CAU 1509]|uniref:glucosylglycerol-phosphate synthase n=1 Tax=Sinimarinibacterium sp. CAU 1509 TaxID=2562283 RepID=UPI0010AC7CAE|nr:glucosylglycerol-phosphate synthase [Sinimarinibacterium sp. CAU 1509]TJY61073.1 glucosylglycerol-phosphate synthase [Sinimarinibacterium sp. CAU 1509]
MLLATDLDGTFLAGPAEDRLRLYQLINSHPAIKLAYVTGRGLESVLSLLSDPTLPQPDYVICDVGATVVQVIDATTLQPLQPLQAQIDARWPGEQAVTTALQDIPGLERQDVPQERRCSYYCSFDAISPELASVIGELGCELLYSAERYLDILPTGVNKGSTLLALIEQLGIDEDDVLVAGDTLNDLAMYEHGFKGVCVGESEEGLLAATHGRARVLHAERPGCGGIVEAIEHFGFLGERGMQLHRTPAMAPGKAELLIVYHRTPYEEVIEKGEVKRRRPASPNGIIPTLVSFFNDGRPGSWVAWAVHDPRVNKNFENYTSFDGDRHPNLTVSRVPLSKSEVDIFYKSFSKEAFWPLLHTFWERARFREDHWEVFLKVNRKFAERVAVDAAEGATVWLHDYNLWMVPAALRELRPDLKIAFFHHTYFPSADVFNVVPWRRAIIGSLLQCDYIGFHIPRQVENFVDVVRGTVPMRVLEEQSAAPRFLTYGCATGLDRYASCIEAGHRVVRLGAHPVGLDTQRVQTLLQREDVRQRMAQLRSDLSGTRVLLSVERLDYTKGTLERLLAFERMLDAHPELIGKITLITICVPAAREMTIYKQLQNQIEQAVGRINGRFSRVGWIPLQFFFRAIPFEELVAYYAMADVMWITPLRDGLNLVSKEFVAVQGMTGGRGVLVLSEFAGAAAELKGAVLTNPHDPQDLASACYLALNMSRAEARTRMRQLFDIVSHFDNKRWGDDFLDAVHAPLPEIPQEQEAS